MASKLDKLMSEVRYIEGKVINDPQTWSDTHVSGSGGYNTGGVKITSKVDTWTSFLVETTDGKELMVKWPESLPVRNSHRIKAAIFREQTIAFVNEKTETFRHSVKVETVTGEDLRIVPIWISFPLLLAAAYFLFDYFNSSTLDDPQIGTGTAVLATIVLIAIVLAPFGFISMFKLSRLKKKLPQEAFKILQGK